MLEEIRIRSLGVIDDAHIELGPGLTVLSGETGAGKTMVLTALSMVLGQKVDASLVRAGADRAACAATFNAPSELSKRASEEFGADVEEGLVLARMLTAEGRSRALLGGASVPAGTLADFGDELVSIHGQGSSSRLLRPSMQRELVDAFGAGQLISTRARHRDLFEQWREVVAAIEALSGDRREAVAEAERLRELMGEVEKLTPSQGEISALGGEIARLSAGDAVISATSLARDALSGDEPSTASTLLSVAQRALAPHRDFDGEIARIVDELLEISTRAEDLGRDLARWIDQLDSDPVRLNEANQRLSALQSLLRRWSESTDDEGLDRLLERYSQAGLRLLDIDGGDERLAELRVQESRLAEQVTLCASELTKLRQEAADAFGAAVTQEVRALSMPHAVVTINVGEAAHTAMGRDDIEFRLAATSQAPAVPLAKGASGGELSRVMLALEVIVAAADPVPTYIFDEVDAGVGGAAAIEVGKRLARLAEHAQVIVVTHLAQVAAFADAHFTVTKGSDGSVTSSTVRSLNRAERAVELARMMAGLASSERAQASGEELLDIAEKFRSGSKSV